MARPLRGPHDLGDETSGPSRPAVAVTNAARPDPEVVVAPPQGLPPLTPIRGMALGPLKPLMFVRRAPARRRRTLPETSIPPTTCARPRSALLSCRPNRWDESELLRHRRLSSIARNVILLFAAVRQATTAERSSAPCSPPRSATGWDGCDPAALEPSRRMFPSD